MNLSPRPLYRRDHMHMFLSRPNRWHALLGSAVAFVLLVLCGCQSPTIPSAMADSYYINPHKSLSTIGRVALVELENKSAYPNISTDMTDALFSAVQKQQIFGVTIVHQDNPDWRGLQDNLDSLQTLKKLLALRDTLQCNALLVGTITQYQPYPRMAVGLRLKLLDLTDGQLLWGLEQVWDSADGSIQKRIKDYFKTEQRSGFAPVQEQLVAISSLQFGKFVAFEVAQTLDQGKKPGSR